jgi:hypothetical protein
MCPVFNNLASCEIRTVIHSHHTEDMSAAEIHHELCVVYIQNERKLCRTFKGGQTNVYDEEQSGWPSVVSDDLVQSVDKEICERW